MDKGIKETRKAARLAPNLPEKLEKQRDLRKFETKRDEAWRDFDAASRELDRQKDTLLDETSKKLEQATSHNFLFSIKWIIK